MTRIVSRCQAVVPADLFETRFVSMRTLRGRWYARLAQLGRRRLG